MRGNTFDCGTSTAQTGGGTGGQTGQPPIVITPLADQSITERDSLSYTIPAGSFQDPEGQTLTYTATLSDGTALPTWLTFSGPTLSSSTPTAGVFAITIKATDTENLSVSDTLTLTVQDDLPPTTQSLSAQTAYLMIAWSYTVPAATFSDPEGETLTYSASKSDGSALPAWLTFDAATRTFAGTPPSGQTSLSLLVAARDPLGQKSSVPFTLTITTLASCKAIYDTVPTAHTDGIYTIDPDGTGSAVPFEVYCDMTTNGGGWTLVATVADDDNNYWTWNNRDYLATGNLYGSLTSWRTADFQSAAWTTVKGTSVLFRASTPSDKWLRYDTILTNAGGQTIASKYTRATPQDIDRTTVGEFAVSQTSGTWKYWCGSLSISLQVPDTDANAWDSGAKGFVWRSGAGTEGSPCNYDDVLGGVAEAKEQYYGGIGGPLAMSAAWENWNKTYYSDLTFYHENFLGGALYVLVR